MGRMTELAQNPVHANPFHETMRVRVEGKSFTEAVESATISYSSDGTSEAVVNTYRSLRGWENAEISIDIGYGRYLENYFTGRIGSMTENHWGGPNEVQCWGPFKLMADQILGTQVDYTGDEIQSALMDLVRRSKFRSGKVEVRQGRSFVLEAESVFPLETTLGSAASTLCGAANFVLTDLPGGRRLMMPKPRAGATGRVNVRYNEGHYPREGFSAVPSNRSFYSKVQVFRRGETGNLEINVTKPVDVESRFKPPQGRTYVIPEFSGSAAGAEKEATETARSLSRGVYDIGMSGIAANTEIAMYDTIQTRTTELREQADVLEYWHTTYNWIVDQGISVTLSRSGNTMDVSGTGILVDEKLVRRVNRQ